MIPFTKMEGAGNDYVYVSGFDHPEAIERILRNPVDITRRISHRHSGVGSDGLILILPPDKGVNAHARMRMFNADGTESEMCGNGIRCVCKHVRDRGHATVNPMRIQTRAGVLELSYELGNDGKVERVTVDMGEPVLELERIPINARLVQRDAHPHCFLIPLESHKDTGGVPATFVSMGNPHAVLYSVPLEDEDMALGPIIENHAAFPRRINVHFVQVMNRGEVRMRTWERGAGLTQACGTGAAAVCVAGVLTGQTDREILAHLPGGDLTLRWDERTNHVFKTGPAREVFTGAWDDSSLAVQDGARARHQTTRERSAVPAR